MATFEPRQFSPRLPRSVTIQLVSADLMNLGRSFVLCGSVHDRSNGSKMKSMIGCKRGLSSPVPKIGLSTECRSLVAPSWDSARQSDRHILGMNAGRLYETLKPFEAHRRDGVGYLRVLATRLQRRSKT